VELLGLCGVEEGSDAEEGFDTEEGFDVALEFVPDGDWPPLELETNAAIAGPGNVYGAEASNV
jgi:hypothetical protein